MHSASCAIHLDCDPRTNHHENTLEGNRAITWVVILVVINTVAIAVGLLFMAPAWSLSQESLTKLPCLP